MAIRRQRGPRPGEILAFVSGRRMDFRAEEGKSGPQLRVSPAPCCANKKRGGSAILSTSTGLWKCWACGAKGNWFGFTRLAGMPLPDPYEDAGPVDFSVYDRIRARLRRPVSAAHHPGLLAACVARGILPSTLDAWRVTSCGPNAIRIPLYALAEEGWRLANARIRQVVDRASCDKEGRPADWFEVKGGPTNLAMGNHLLGRDPLLRGAEGPSWLREWLDPSRAPTGGAFAAVRRVLIVEGQWDAMTAYQLGIPNVLSLPNGASAVDVAGLLRYVPDDAEVRLAVDMDAAGDRTAELFFAQLGTACVRLQLPEKDLNAWLMKSPDLTAEEVLATATTDKPDLAPFVDILAPRANKVSEIVAETPWPRLTSRLGGGFKASQTTGLLAPSGTGKTTLANVVVAAAIAQGARVGVIQLEGTVDDNADLLTRQILGWTQPDDVEVMLSLYAKRLRVSSLNGKAVTWQETIDEAERMMKDECRLVVVDNWDHIIPPDASGSRAKASAYAELQRLCKSYRTHGFVVWQPNKVDRGTTVNSGQQKGLSTALQDADVYLVLNKMGLARRLDVEKVRGVAEKDESLDRLILRYDEGRQILLESDSQADLRPVDEKEPPI